MERLPETSDIVYMDGTGREKSKEQTPDVVFCYHGGEGRNILIAFQNQKHMSLIMPVRESLSASLLYERQIQERKTELKNQKVLTKGADFKINVIHGGNVDPKHFRTGLRRLFELLPYAADKKAMMAYVRENPSHFDNLDEESCEMMASFLGCNALGEEKRLAYRNQKGGYDMCTALEDLKQEGIDIGEKRGISIGEERGIAIGEKRGIHRASEAILTLVSCMLGGEDASKIPQLRNDLKLRQEMMEKYQVQL